MLCDLNVLLQEKIVKMLKIDDIHNLCLISKQCHNKYSKKSKLWTALAKTQFSSNPLARENPMLYYYMNKVNVLAIGDNIDNMFGVESEVLTQLTPILSGVKTLVLSYGVTFAIKYDNSLYYMGNSDTAKNFSLSGNGFPKNVKSILISGNDMGLILTLDGILYLTRTDDLFQIMDTVRKIHRVPDTEDFLVERTDGMYLVTLEDPSDIMGVNVQIKFGTCQDLGNDGKICKVEIWIDGQYQKTVNDFNYDFILTSDNRLYSIKYDLKIAESVLSFDWKTQTMSRATKHIICWSSTSGYFNMTVISTDDLRIPQLEHLVFIKFESPIIKMVVYTDFCILLLQNGSLFFGGDIPDELSSLIPSSVPISSLKGDLEYVVTNAIPVLDDIRDFQFEPSSYLAVVKNV